MKNRKKVRYLAAAGLLGTSLLCSGCRGGAKEENRSLRIGVIVYNQYDTFISEMMGRFTTAINKKISETGRSITLEVQDAAGSQATQNDQVRLLIEKGCDVICVNLVDRTEPTTITDLAEKNQVPIIFFNRELVAEDLERWDQLYYVGADATQSGIMQGEIAAQIYKEDETADKNGDGTFQYVILEGEAGHQDTIIRTEYSVNAIKEAGVPVEKLGYARANWNRAQAKTQTASLLEQYGSRIELILANNDDMALGAIDALEAEGIAREDWPKVLGIDGTGVGLASIKSKKLSGTVYNDSTGQAEAMANLAYTLASEGDLAEIPFTEGRYIRLPYSPVTAENVSEFN